MIEKAFFNTTKSWMGLIAVYIKQLGKKYNCLRWKAEFHQIKLVQYILICTK